MNELLDGEHEGARILNSTITQTKAGLPQASVKFSVDGHVLFWNGSFKEGSMDNTMKQLIHMGLRNKVADLVDDVLDKDKLFTVTVGTNVWEGKSTKRIDWVQTPYTGQAGLDRATAAGLVAALDGHLARVKKEVGANAVDAMDAPF